MDDGLEAAPHIHALYHTFNSISHTRRHSTCYLIKETKNRAVQAQLGLIVHPHTHTDTMMVQDPDQTAVEACVDSSMIYCVTCDCLGNCILFFNEVKCSILRPSLDRPHHKDCATLFTCFMQVVLYFNKVMTQPIPAVGLSQVSLDLNILGSVWDQLDSKRS